MPILMVDDGSCGVRVETNESGGSRGDTRGARRTRNHRAIQAGFGGDWEACNFWREAPIRPRCPVCSPTENFLTQPSGINISAHNFPAHTSGRKLWQEDLGQENYSGCIAGFFFRRIRARARTPGPQSTRLSKPCGSCCASPTGENARLTSA